METRMSGEAVEEELQCLEGVGGVGGVRVCGWMWMWMWDVPVEIAICGWSLKLLFSGGDVAGLEPDPSHSGGVPILSSASSFLSSFTSSSSSSSPPFSNVAVVHLEYGMSILCLPRQY